MLLNIEKYSRKEMLFDKSNNYQFLFCVVA
jgi:hypothetical protein